MEDEQLKKITGNKKKDWSFLIQPVGFLVILAVVLIIAFSGLGGVSKNDIATVVNNNQETLLADIQTKNFSASMMIPRVNQVTDNGTYIDYNCGGSGLGSETNSFGFYYIANDDITSVNDKEWTAEGEGFIQREEDSDDTLYLEKICDNFYYYDMHV